MPDLGKYTDTVLSAYAVSILVLILLVVVTVLRGRKIRARMTQVEEKARRNG